MKAAELRKSILQAAVQGRLVPQDLHDEPASDLLERIRAEKARLVKEGKIKKEKPLPPISDDEVPYDLPEGWVWCRLGEITTILRGASPRPKGDPKYWSRERTPYHWIKISDISKYTDYDVLYDTDEFLTEDGKELSVFVDSNYIITAASGSIGKSALLGITGYIYDGLLAIRVYGETLNKRYVISYISSIVAHLVDESTGTSWKNIRTDTLKNALFPLPPLAEQRRIVAKVNELMALCDELEAAEQELDALESCFEEYLPKSILQAAVQGKLVPQDIHDEPASVLLERVRAEKERLVKEGKIKKEKPLPPIAEDEIPYDLPEGWVWCRLSDVGEIVGGSTPDTSNAFYYTDPGNGMPWITPADMKNAIENTIYRGKKDITVDGYNSCSTRIIPKGSIIFSSRAPIGLIAFAGNDLCTNQGFKSVIPYIMDLRNWIYYSLQNKTEDIINRAPGTTFKEVSGSFMQKEIIPLPPLAEQWRIVAKVYELMALCEEIKAVKTKPIEQKDTNKVIEFPALKQDGQFQLAARGGISKKSSNELMQAIDEMFAEDE